MMHTQHIESASPDAREGARHGERGYTLVALLALMTIMLLFITAAAPTIRQQTQRERENEAIYRGEEVAEAIRRFAQANNGQLPTSMDQLLEGVSRGTKKVQILRPVAAKDPLSEKGEWRLVRPNDAALLKFQVSVTLYAGGRQPETREPSLRKYATALRGITNLGTSDESATSGKDETSADETDESSGGEDDSINSTGPFIGVASRSRTKSIINYYGIERHDRWVFTPLFR
jgi:type II secretory pathway pseudopilin PulG